MCDMKGQPLSLLNVNIVTRETLNTFQTMKNFVDLENLAEIENPDFG